MIWVTAGAACASAVAVPLYADGRSSTRAAATADVHRLPLGDGRVSTTRARRGWVYECRQMSGGGGAIRNGPWIHSDGTFDLTAKPTVNGAVAWPAARVRITRRRGRVHVTGNGLPVRARTGRFPVAPGDDAYAYDPNPNAISAQRVSLTLPPPGARRGRAA